MKFAFLQFLIQFHLSQTEIGIKVIRIIVTILQIMRKNVDFILTSTYTRLTTELIDFSNYVDYNIVFFNVCFPRRIKGYFNFLRPFG